MSPIEKRFSKIARVIGYVNPSRMLDIGCGKGELYRYISELDRNTNYIGLDINLNQVQNLDRPSARDPSFIYGDCLNLPLKEGSIDCVTMLEVLEHLKKPVEALLEAKRVLKQGGSLIVTIPNADRLTERFKKEQACISKDHFKEYDSLDAESLVKKAGFVNISISSIYLDLPFSLELLGEEKDLILSAGTRILDIFDKLNFYLGLWLLIIAEKP